MTRPVAAPAPAVPVDLTRLEAARFVIVGEWLAEAVTGCTCGTGDTGYGHEAGCGLEPVAKIADLLAAEVARPQLLAASRAVERVRALLSSLESAVASVGPDELPTIDPRVVAAQLRAAIGGAE